MIAAIEAGVIEAYQIIDSTNNFSEVIPNVSFKSTDSNLFSEAKINIPIFYPGSSDQWGFKY